MTIRSLSRFVLVGVLLASFNASAIPGSGSRVTVRQYGIQCDRSQREDVYHQLHREPGPEWFYQHSVFLTLADDKMVSSHDDDTTITVVMDHQQYIIPSSLGWRNGDNARFDFISNISEAGQFDVYVNDHKAGTFTADRKNAEKVLSTRRLQQRLIVVSSPAIHPDS